MELRPLRRYVILDVVISMLPDVIASLDHKISILDVVVSILDDAMSILNSAFFVHDKNLLCNRMRNIRIVALYIKSQMKWQEVAKCFDAAEVDVLISAVGNCGGFPLVLVYVVCNPTAFLGCNALYQNFQCEHRQFVSMFKTCHAKKHYIRKFSNLSITQIHCCFCVLHACLICAL